MRLTPALLLSSIACGSSLEVVEVRPDPFEENQLLVTESTCPGSELCDRLLLLSRDLPPVVLVAAEPGQRLDGSAFSPDGETLIYTRFLPDAAAAVEVLTGDERVVIEDASEPALAPGGGRLALTRGNREGIEVWSLSGERLGTVTQPGLDAGSPRWKPSGTWLAFVAGPERRLWRASADGSAALPYPDIVGVIEATFSPDGSMVLVSGDEGVFTVDFESGARRGLLLSGSSFAWAPDGDAIAYLTDPVGGRSRLLVYEPRVGRSPAVHAVGEKVLGGYAWSPHGDWLAWSTGTISWAVPREGGEPVALHQSDGAQRDPRWRP